MCVLVFTNDPYPLRVCNHAYLEKTWSIFIWLCPTIIKWISTFPKMPLYTSTARNATRWLFLFSPTQLSTCRCSLMILHDWPLSFRRRSSLAILRYIDVQTRLLPESSASWKAGAECLEHRACLLYFLSALPTTYTSHTVAMVITEHDYIVTIVGPTRSWAVSFPNARFLFIETRHAQVLVRCKYR